MWVHLLLQAVSFKADNSRVRGELAEAREDIREDDRDTSEYIEQLEAKMEDMKRLHTKKLLAAQKKHDDEVGASLACTMMR